MPREKRDDEGNLYGTLYKAKPEDVRYLTHKSVDDPVGMDTILKWGLGIDNIPARRYIP